MPAPRPRGQEVRPDEPAHGYTESKNNTYHANVSANMAPCLDARFLSSSADLPRIATKIHPTNPKPIFHNANPLHRRRPKTSRHHTSLGFHLGIGIRGGLSNAHLSIILPVLFFRPLVEFGAELSFLDSLE